MNHLLFIIILIIAFASNSKADIDCGETIFSKTYAISNMLKDVDEYAESFQIITCDDIFEVEKSIREINSFVGDSLSLPTVGVHLTPSSKRVFYANIINIPISLIVEGYEIHPIYTTYAWAHEYGHAIFAENMKKTEFDGKAWIMMGEMTSVVIEQELEMQRFKNKMIKLYSRQKKFKIGSSEYKEIGKEIEGLEKEFERIEEQNMHQFDSELSEFVRERRAIAEPYNELFSDLVSVLYAFDPTAVAEALNRTHAWSNDWMGFKSSVIARDFTDRKNRLDNNWLVQKEIHNLFAPVRYHLFEKYLEQHLRPDKRKIIRNGKKYDYRGLLLKGVFSAIVKEIKNLSSRIKELSPFFPLGMFYRVDNKEIKKLNSDLIKAIDIELKGIRR